MTFRRSAPAFLSAAAVLATVSGLVPACLAQQSNSDPEPRVVLCFQCPGPPVQGAAFDDPEPPRVAPAKKDTQPPDPEQTSDDPDLASRAREAPENRGVAPTSDTEPSTVAPQ
jgi:hypothetical protein